MFVNNKCLSSITSIQKKINGTIGLQILQKYKMIIPTTRGVRGDKDASADSGGVIIDHESKARECCACEK
jgi:hypothetical protein